MHAKLKNLLTALLLILLGLACQTSVSSFPDEYQYYNDEPSDSPPLDATSLPPTMTPEPTDTPAATQGLLGTPTEFVPGMGGNPEDVIVTPIVISMDLNSVFAEVVGSLPQGSALFNPPEEMRLGEAHAVEVRIVPVTEQEIEESEALKAALTENLEGEQEVIVIPLRVSTVMTAQLSGAAFEIIPDIPIEQIRDPDEPYMRWLWEVTPQKTGEQRLTLTLSVMVRAEGEEKPHFKKEVRKVLVTGNPMYSVSNFFGSNWEFVITGLLFPVLGWGWKKMRDRRKSVR